MDSDGDVTLDSVDLEILKVHSNGKSLEHKQVEDELGLAMVLRNKNPFSSRQSPIATSHPLTSMRVPTDLCEVLPRKGVRTYYDEHPTKKIL